MKTLYMIIGAVVLVIVAGAGGFFAGNSYGQAQAQNIRTTFLRQRFGDLGNGASGQGFQGGQGAQGGPFGRPVAAGTLKSVDGNTLTIAQNDGSTITVEVNGQTVIEKTVTGTATDLKPGERITVLSDQTGNNLVARTIQIRPSTTQ
jgi:hypothetical protein